MERSEVSDCESGISGSTHEVDSPFAWENGLIPVDEGEQAYNTIKQKLLSGLGVLGSQTRIEGIYKSSYQGLIKEIKLKIFGIFSKAVEKKNGGSANVEFAWYGASSMDEINAILSHGFAPKINNAGSYSHGHGIHLCPSNFSLGCLKSAVADENGVRHLLLCRVILGKMEVVPPGSGQWHPSSEEFDSGVDDSVSPRKYIMWSTNMNTHILPQYVVSFRVPASVKGVQRNSVPLRLPNSPWISFPALVSALGKFLPPQSMKLITKYQKDHRERRITRHEMIQHVRKLAGDDLLATIIKAQRDKLGTMEGSLDSSLTPLRCSLCYNNNLVEIAGRVVEEFRAVQQDANSDEFFDGDDAFSGMENDTSREAASKEEETKDVCSLGNGVFSDFRR
nr:probable inactive poly [ADP-ribose] polymerase SRO5 isoform X1 [Ipomoea trifida]